jgi:hypothetical protein
VSKKPRLNRYSRLLGLIFKQRFEPGSAEVSFGREDLVTAARALKMRLPKNLGDVIYSFRYRTSLPPEILATQPAGMEWVIQGRGRSQYAFRLSQVSQIEPNPHLAPIKIPDATPQIVSAYALTDEQALLARVRYNRLLDVFLGAVAYSLQNHLRTTVQDVGQVEIDEIYVAVDSRGRQYVVPVQAKGGKDRLSSVQTLQDIACCKEKYPNLICRAVSAQFMPDSVIALFELDIIDGEIRIVEERHYKLVPAEEIGPEDLESYSTRP